jgi:hypothetical protein
VRPDADWCTLCFADLRVQPEQPEPPAVEAEPPGEPVIEPAADAEPPSVPNQDGRGKHARSAAAYDDAVVHRTGTPLDEAAYAALDVRAAEMLAILAAESSHPLGPWAQRLDSTQSRVIAGFVVAGGLLAIGLLFMTVLGQFV